MERIDAVLAALNSMPVPDPGEDYGRRVWQQIAPRLPEKRGHWWSFLFVAPRRVNWLEPRRWVAAGAIAALVIAAFLAGRATRRGGAGFVADGQGKGRQRGLVIAVGGAPGRFPNGGCGRGHRR